MQSTVYFSFWKYAANWEHKHPYHHESIHTVCRPSDAASTIFDESFVAIGLSRLVREDLDTSHVWLPTTTTTTATATVITETRLDKTEAVIARCLLPILMARQAWVGNLLERIVPACGDCIVNQHICEIGAKTAPAGAGSIAS